MIPDGLDLIVVSKLTSQQVEQVTCVECCKYYIAPETASCGHTLCHGCWTGRRSCPACASPLDRRTLRLNIPLQTLTEHVHVFGDAFEKLFSIKLDEFVLDTPDNNMEVVNDPSKNVKEWLASSQNHFSAPALSSQHSTQDLVQAIELSTSKIQIHMSDQKIESYSKVTKKVESPPKLIHSQHSQDDWDKIEILPDTEDTGKKNKENVVGPMGIEPFFIDDEYTTENPRRSSRKRDVKNDSKLQTRDISSDKHSSKNSSSETDKKSVKAKQNWNNVKKMRKEFSKLNKKSRSKLNVSIEMCKKAQGNVSKPVSTTPLAVSQQACYMIDDNTPDITNNEKETVPKVPSYQSKIYDDQNTKNNIISTHDSFKVTVNDNNNVENTSQNKENIASTNIENMNNVKNVDSNICSSTNEYEMNKKSTFVHNCKTKTLNMPILKKSSLHQNPIEDDCIKITQNDIDPTINTDDIEISIKVGSTVTNIIIKKKQNDVQLKLNTDRGIQTSIGPFGLQDKNDASCSPMTQNTKVDAEIGPKNAEVLSVNKSISTKKHTDSADTATANFEITESVEKELSDLMECVETGCTKNKGTKTSSKKKYSSQVKTTDKVNETPEDLECDLDIFNSGSVKEANIHLLKNTMHAPSEILMPTLKNKKSQKFVNKRDRDVNDETAMPRNKKQKLDSDKIHETPMDVSIDEKNKDVANVSEPMNYNAIMSQVFANIDADIKGSNTQNLKIDKEIDNSIKQTQNIPKTQTNQNPKDISLSTDGTDAVNIKEFVNQKYSENVFSFLDKDSEPHDTTKSKNNQHPDQESTQQRIDKLLTPGMCRELSSSNRDDHTQANDVDIMEVLGTPLVDHDDSDKSVVEETPQKNLSFSKLKPNGDLSNKNDKQQLQKKNLEEKHTDSQIIKSIINISDTSGESNKIKDTTVIEMAKKKHTLETPLTINKFVDHIKHNSTPVARKSLNFDSENLEDLEQTLCPTTTQEKEFLVKAFERTPNSPIKRPLGLKNIKDRGNKKFCLAGSCLNSAELSNVKILCLNRGWTYVDKYTKDLTHLVVGVDEENKSQR